MDGIILINKEKSWTSFDVVAKLRNQLKTKVGHTGTLDPMATGLLVILLGNACKLEKYMVIKDKSYVVDIKFGIKTNTADISGDVIKEEKFMLNQFSLEEIKEKVKKFIGKQKQIPPKYSALKYEGESLYRLAREKLVSKEEMDGILKSKIREVEISSIKILDIIYDENILKLEVKCSSGTYIRTLAEDIAEKGFSTIGTVNELDRRSVGKYLVDDSMKINDFLLLNNDELKKQILSVENTFDKYPKTRIEESRVYYFVNGVRITNKVKEGLYRVYSYNKMDEKTDENKKDKFVGLGIVKDNLMKREYIYESL